SGHQWGMSAHAVKDRANSDKGASVQIQVADQGMRGQA
ncbi:MAG: hypothetical protein JWQ08_1438, partial [Deinococcus sp.]|nr:hypothetical protein [Deinococcus sp.]